MKKYICKSCGYTSNSSKHMHFKIKKCNEKDKTVVISCICNKCKNKE